MDQPLICVYRLKLFVIIYDGCCRLLDPLSRQEKALAMCGKICRIKVGVCAIIGTSSVKINECSIQKKQDFRRFVDEHVVALRSGVYGISMIADIRNRIL